MMKYLVYFTFCDKFYLKIKIITLNLLNFAISCFLVITLVENQNFNSEKHSKMLRFSRNVKRNKKQKKKNLSQNKKNFKKYIEAVTSYFIEYLAT